MTARTVWKKISSHYDGSGASQFIGAKKHSPFGQNLAPIFFEAFEVPMVVEEEIGINAPLPVVWQIFSRMEEWDAWNTACRSCTIVDGDAMNTGTCFSFVIRPLKFPIKVQPKIVKCDPGREVVWEGRRFGIHATHTWRFREADGKVYLLSVEKFQGPLVWFSYLLMVPKRLHQLTEAFLQSVKSTAEACSG
jgi:hypothetical protein